jgi:hypothetical protein
MSVRSVPAPNGQRAAAAAVGSGQWAVGNGQWAVGSSPGVGGRSGDPALHTPASGSGSATSGGTKEQRHRGTEALRR